MNNDYHAMPDKDLAGYNQFVRRMIRRREAKNRVFVANCWFAIQILIIFGALCFIAQKIAELSRAM